MAGPIPQTFIDDILNRTDIVELIDRRVNLKKAGKEFTACCPFHSEKTPSFTVSPQKQFYHCFGCGAHGTAISFLMEYDRLSFIEAIEELAHNLGLEVPREQGNPQAKQYQEQNKPLYDILEEIASYFEQQLRDHLEAPKAIDYLKGRGLSGAIAKQFRVGFAPSGWTNLCDRYQSAEQRALLVKAGLIVQKDNGDYYDRFRNRIVFPILDKRGRVIAFGGRVIDPNDKPKYYNSPETPVFQKSRELYGLYEARHAKQRVKRLMVVEGYVDVVSLAQFDIPYAVATLGTATSKEHIEALFRVVSDVVFCFDGDRAGRQAAWRAMENSIGSIKQGRQLSFLFLPDGEDPDSMVRTEGKEAFEQRISNAMAIDDFILTTLMQGTDIDRADGKARCIESIKPILGKIQDSIFRELFVEKAAHTLKVDRQLIESLSHNLETNAPEASFTQQQQRHFRQTVSRTPVRAAITILLHVPQAAKDLTDTQFLEAIDLPGIDVLQSLINTLKDSPELSPPALLERYRESEVYTHLNKLAQLDVPGETENLAEELRDILHYLQQQTAQARWDFLHEKLQLQGLSADEKREYQQLLVRQDTESP